MYITDEKKLTDTERSLMARLDNAANRQAPVDRENLAYYLGKQAITFLGLRLRGEWLAQAFPLTWCRTLVNVVVERQQVLRLLRRGVDTEDKNLRQSWDASDMDSQMPRLATDLAIYGRCYISVAIDTVTKRPRMVAEPVTAMTIVSDALGQTEAAMRRYWDENDREVRRVLYLPNATIITGGPGGREVIERNDHNLGRVPVVMAVMGDLDGTRKGSAIFEPIKRLADTSAETLLNARVALETTASPQKAMIDAARQVVDEDGNQVEIFEAFYDSILTVFSGESSDGKPLKADIKQFPGAEMTGFFKTIEMLGQQASSATGLPMRMLGHVTANPPSEMTVRGEESRLVRMVDNYNAALGAALGWALGIDERLRTGAWPEDGAIDISWRDPGTPTYAQQADALVKMVQVKMMSKRSALEELGWSDTRIDRELERLQEEEDADFLDYRALGRPAAPEDDSEDGDG